MLTLPLSSYFVLTHKHPLSPWISAGSSPQRLSPLGLVIFFQHHLTPGFFLGVQLWTMRNSLCLQWVEVKLTHQCLSPHSNQSLVFRCMEYFPGITTLQIQWTYSAFHLYSLKQFSDCLGQEEHSEGGERKHTQY